MIATEGKMYLVKIYPWPPLRNGTGQEYLHQNHYPLSNSQSKDRNIPKSNLIIFCNEVRLWSSCGLGLNSFLSTQHMKPAEEDRTLTSTEDLGSFSSSSSLVYLVTFLDWTWQDGLTSPLLPHCSVSSHFKLNHGTWSFSARYPFLPRGLSSRSKISLDITGQPWAGWGWGGVIVASLPRSSQYCRTSVSVRLF